MANPNIVSVASIYGECCGWALTNTLTTTLFTVLANKLIKINRIVCANVDGTNAANLDLYITPNIQTSVGGTVASGATNIYLAKTISVPANASLVVSDTPIYLRELDILKGGASAVSDLELFITYEVIAV
tara:strand:+ start:20 stop:409 length:390 start_codon:yes stop_codon:yes gene_type:complete